MKLLTPRGLFSLAGAFLSTGVNLFAILHTAYKLYPGKIALSTGDNEYTYRELFFSTRQLAHWLRQNVPVARKQKIAVIGENSPELVFIVFAAALLGADIYLLNTQMSTAQLKELTDRFSFRALFYGDGAGADFSALAGGGCRVLSCDRCLDAAREQAHTPAAKIIGVKRNHFNRLVVFTSGTTGAHTAAGRRASVSNYLQVFISLFKQLKLHKYDSLYLAPPLCHGFGIATLCVSLLLGKQTFLLPGFDAVRACRLVGGRNIQVATLVPLMLQRMIEQDAGSLSSLECLISGGAPLSASLLEKTRQTLGDKLYNLYGSSEAGVCTLATPEDLARFPDTIGRPLAGVQIEIIMPDKQKADAGTEGELCVRCSWSVNKYEWVHTRDKGYRNEQGYYFLTGRLDNMIVSGGVNVYPSVLQDALRQHPGIRDAIVVGIDDSEFGKRLKAIVIPASGSEPDEKQIMRWLTGKVSKSQMPKTIRFTNCFPVTAAGKPDDAALRGL